MAMRRILLGPVLVAALLSSGCTLLGAEYKSETTEYKQDTGLEQHLHNLEMRIDRIEAKIDRLEARR